MSEQLDYECLPQRAPRQKRRRLLDAKTPETAPGDADATLDAPATEAVKGAEEPGAADIPTNTETIDAEKDTIDRDNKDKDKQGASRVPSNDIEEPLAYRLAAETGQKFEYLDHTADVQLHAWGGNLQEAFENVALCMFNYMTPLEGIDAEGPSAETRYYKSEAHDLPSLLYHWLDELLFDFSSDFFVAKTLEITLFDREGWKIEAEATGERFDRGRHVSGTEIKAITYSAMQINETEGDAEVFVIVDI